MTPALRSVPAQPARAVLYLRQSVRRDDSVSMELQETAGRDYCARQGHVVTDVVRDHGISGLKWQSRPGVVEVLRRVEAREVDVIVVWRWSRLSRSRLHQATALDRVERAGARVESATEPFDTTTAGGEFGRDVMLAAAHFESRQKGEQWREAHQRRIGLGLPSRGGGRYGYQLDAGTYTLDPVTGPVLAGMYRDFTAGAGFSAIAYQLNREGHRTRTGGAWTRDRVGRVLDSGFGAGQLVAGKGRAAHHEPGVHPPVITPDEWTGYQAARAARRGVPPRVSSPSYPLTGLIRCGDCRAPMHATTLGRHAGYGYVCSRWMSSRQCRCVTVTRAKAEAAVVDWLRVWDTPDGAERNRAHAARDAAQVVAVADARDLARQVTRVDDRLTRLTLGWTDGTVPDVAYRAARDELDDTRAALVVRLAEAERDTARHALPLRPSAVTLLGLWDTVPARECRDLLMPLVREVLVHRAPGDERWVGVTVEVVPAWDDPHADL